MSKRIAMAGALLAFGCSEGVKPNPLPRAVPTVDVRKDAGDAIPKLYARLGGEEGLKQTVEKLAQNLSGNPRRKALADKLDANQQQRILREFLMDVSSNSRPKEVPSFDEAEWSLLLPALDKTLNDLDAAEADRNELMTNLRTVLKGAKK